MFRLAVQSLLNRRLTAGLTVLSVAVSVALLVSVDRLRSEAKASFANTISGADLIVGARSGPINLLLYSIFRIGDATNNIAWSSYQAIADRPEVAWTIPLSLGDAHRGFRVLGTTGEYFEHYRFGTGRRLEFAEGAEFARLGDAVLGADVARSLGYRLGDSLVVSHGIGDASFQHHDDLPFAVSGILRPTGTPVDATVHVSLAAIDAIHSDGTEHAHDDDHHADEDDHGEADHHDHEAEHHDEPEHHDDEADHHDEAAHHHEADHHDDEAEHAQADHHDDESGHHDEADHHDEEDHAGTEDHDGEAHHHDEPDHADHHAETERHGDDAEHHDDHKEATANAPLSTDFAPDAITAMIVGLESRPLLFGVQRFVNEYAAEPLTAIVPGVALQQLWELVGVAETALLAVSACVVAAGLIGMLTMLLTGMAERRREMAVLRSVGAGPGLVFGLLVAEAAILAFVAAVVGVAAVHGGMWAARPLLLEQFGLHLAAGWPGPFDLAVVLLVTFAGALVAALPAWRAYRFSLADGLTVRT